MAPLSTLEPSVAMVGLGIMGSALAGNLITHGFHVSGYDPDAEASKSAESEGIAVAPSLIDAICRSDIILASLPSETALDATVTTILENASLVQKKPVVVELSTLSLECKNEARNRLFDTDIDVLDCPISGTGAQAKTGDIVLYASGDEHIYDCCKPIFDAIARESFYLGDFGNGTRMKFIANLLVAIHNVASAEALMLARLAGLEPQMVYDVIASGAGTSRIFELRGPMMVQESYTPATMKLDVWQKDMALIADFAERLEAETPLFDVTKPLYEKANDLGFGEHDTAAVIEILKRSLP